jgi:hypothetical protein
MGGPWSKVVLYIGKKVPFVMRTVPSLTLVLSWPNQMLPLTLITLY